MSILLDSGPHTVTVFPEIHGEDSRGNQFYKPSDIGIVIHGCLMTPLASTRGAFAAVSVQQGQRVDAAWRLFARSAPIGWWSRVEWNGLSLAILGGPLYFTSSDGTQHVSATLKEER